MPATRSFLPCNCLVFAVLLILVQCHRSAWSYFVTQTGPFLCAGGWIPFPQRSRSNASHVSSALQLWVTSSAGLKLIFFVTEFMSYALGSRDFTTVSYISSVDLPRS